MLIGSGPGCKKLICVMRLQRKVKVSESEPLTWVQSIAVEVTVRREMHKWRGWEESLLRPFASFWRVHTIIGIGFM